MQNNDSVLDMEVIAMLRELGGDDDPGLLTELIDLFLADAPTYLAALSEALQRGDATGLEQAAHTLKSSSANIGAVQLSEFCKELELAGKSNAVSASSAVLQRTQEHFLLVRKSLESLRA